MNWKKAGSLRICEADLPRKTSRLCNEYQITLRALSWTCWAFFCLRAITPALPYAYISFPQYILLTWFFLHASLLQHSLSGQLPNHSHLNHKPMSVFALLLPCFISFLELTNMPYVFLFILFTVSRTKIHDSVRTKNCICFVYSYPQHLNQWLTNSIKCLLKWMKPKKCRDIKIEEWSWCYESHELFWLTLLKCFLSPYSVPSINMLASHVVSHDYMSLPQ